MTYVDLHTLEEGADVTLRDARTVGDPDDYRLGVVS